MSVIVMTREMGTLGKDVAQGVADQMGCKVVHHELIERALAERTEMSESAVHRYLEGSASLIERWKIDSNQLSLYTAEGLLKLAQEGNVVIRGWGAAELFHEIPHVLRVRVCAPMAFRERVMMERLGIQEAALVRREIERNDAAHTRTMQGRYGLAWQNPLLYHLVLNTGYMSVETCVKQVRQLAEDPMFQESKDSRLLIADKLLETRVHTVLTYRSRTGTDSFDIEASVRGGVVTLTGTVFQKWLSTKIEEIVRSVGGVSEIENRIVVIRPHSGVV